MSARVLMIEDSESKVAAFREHLSSCFDAQSIRCDVVNNSSDARRELRRHRYDLVILDIALPLFPGESPRPAAGLDFLKEITTDEENYSPTYIFGITEHEDGFAALQKEFEKRAWPLARSALASTEWLRKIEALVRHILSNKKNQRHSVDFVIATALYEPEMTAMLSLDWAWAAAEPIDEATIARRGRFSVAGREFSVLAVWPHRMGLVAAASLVTKVIQQFRPRVICAPGICAGVPGKTQLGDIVLASEAWTWESGKIVSVPVPGTVLPDPHAVSASAGFVTLGQQLQGDVKWLLQLRSEWTAEAPSAPPKFLIGPMASGSAVVANMGTVESILSKSRKTIAIDMESYAVYAAATLGGQPAPKWFCIKSVCDFADVRKGDELQNYCAYLAARAAQRLCEEAAKQWG